MASQLADRLESVAAALRGAGINATTDPRDLILPGAWVTVHDVTDPVLCGGLTIRADVCLIAGDQGTPVYLDALGQMLDVAAGVLTLDEPGRPMTVAPPGLSPMPALVITTTTE